jgi:hypothetical protein
MNFLCANRNQAVHCTKFLKCMVFGILNAIHQDPPLNFQFGHVETELSEQTFWHTGFWNSEPSKMMTQTNTDASHQPIWSYTWMQRASISLSLVIMGWMVALYF